MPSLDALTLEDVINERNILKRLHSRLEKQHDVQSERMVYQAIGSRLRGVNKASCGLLDPVGWFRTIWDFTGALLTLAIAFLVPVHIAFYLDAASCEYWSISPIPFQPESARYVPEMMSREGYAFFRLTNVFFLVDIVLNFVTGKLVRDPEGTYVDYHFGHICKGYLKRWFWLDTLGCLPITCIILNIFPTRNCYNLGYLITYVRVAKVVRRAHGDPSRFLNYLVGGWKHEISYTRRQVLYFSFFLFFSLHCTACMLWMALRLADMPDLSWPVQLGLLERCVGVQYAWSMFCVMSAMIGLSWSPYPPTSEHEAVAWTLIMFIMAVMFAVFNGFIFVEVLSSVKLGAKYKDHIDSVLHVLDRRHTPAGLKRRVLQYLKFKYRSLRVWDDAELLGGLPYSMRLEVSMLATSHLLVRVPVLAACPSLLERTSLLLKHDCAAQGETMAQEGRRCYRTYFIASGYADLRVGGDLVETLHAGGHFNDHALLIPPTREQLEAILQQEDAPPETRAWLAEMRSRFLIFGTVTAVTNCELYKLEAAEFHELLEDYPEVKAKLQQLGLAYTRRLVALRRRRAQPPTGYAASHAVRPYAAGSWYQGPGQPPSPPPTGAAQAHLSSQPPSPPAATVHWRTEGPWQQQQQQQWQEKKRREQGQGEGQQQRWQGQQEGGGELERPLLQGLLPEGSEGGAGPAGDPAPNGRHARIMDMGQ